MELKTLPKTHPHNEKMKAKRIKPKTIYNLLYTTSTCYISSLIKPWKTTIQSVDNSGGNLATFKVSRWCIVAIAWIIKWRLARLRVGRRVRCSDVLSVAVIASASEISSRLQDTWVSFETVINPSDRLRSYRHRFRRAIKILNASI